MLSRSLFLASLVPAFLLLAPTVAFADDTYRLALPASSSASTRDLLSRPADLQDDTLNVFYRSRRGFYGGFGGYGYYTPRYYGFAPRYYNFFPRYYSSFPRYYGGYSRGYFPGYSTFYPRYYGYSAYPAYSYYNYSAYPGFNYYNYSYPIYNYGYSYYYAPCSLPATVVTPLMPRIIESGSSTPNRGSAMPPSSSLGTPTYPYDGGPTTPVPMPSSDGTETLTLQFPRVPTVVGTLPVSTRTTNSTGKWSYPAYGETPRRSGN